MFFRVLRHLLPTGWAWRLPVGSNIRKFFQGLTGLPEDAREFIDEAHDDIYPDRTRDLDSWESQFALPGDGSEPQRRQDLAAAWQAMGGQSPAYIQGIMQAAGFPVYVHEYWDELGNVRDPRNFTNQPLLGTTRCKAPNDPNDPGTHQARCTDNTPFSTWRCNRELANFTRYIVNNDLTNRAPPPVPDDPDFWPYFLYIGGQTFGDTVAIPAARRREFERLLLKMCPTQHWIVIDVAYLPPGEIFFFNGGSGWNAGQWV